MLDSPSCSQSDKDADNPSPSRPRPPALPVLQNVAGGRSARDLPDGIPVRLRRLGSGGQGESHAVTPSRWSRQSGRGQSHGATWAWRILALRSETVRAQKPD